MTALVVAAVTCAAWVYLALGRGGFWLGRETDAEMHDALRDVPEGFAWPHVVAVIPARNEALLVGQTVASLLAQSYGGRLDVVVVDDHSDDGTADVAQRAAAELGAASRLTVLAAPPLPGDWTGKLWAVAQGVGHVEALASPPAFVLLTDADIRYDGHAVAALVFAACQRRWALSSLMVKLRCLSFAERAFIPAFVFFFQMIYPFAWVNQVTRRLAAAAGGCMLVRLPALQESGGIAAIRGEIIDDCALGGRLKRTGPIHLALGDHVQSLRESPSLAQIRQMVVRSAYAQLRYSPWQLAFVVVAMAVVFVAPVGLAIFGSGWTRGLAAVAWLIMAVVFVPTTRRFGVGVLWGFALPAVAAVYLLFTIESAVQHMLGRGGVWKGRAQAHAAKAAR